MGYNKKSECITFANRTQNDWTNLKIIIFDTPKSDKPYIQRLQLLKESMELFTLFTYSDIPVNHSILTLISAIKCEDKHHFNAFFTKITSFGGEGVVLRKPLACYYEKGCFLKKEVYNIG